MSSVKILPHLRSVATLPLQYLASFSTTGHWPYIYTYYYAEAAETYIKHQKVYRHNETNLNRRGTKNQFVQCLRGVLCALLGPLG